MSNGTEGMRHQPQENGSLQEPCCTARTISVAP